MKLMPDSKVSNGRTAEPTKQRMQDGVVRSTEQSPEVRETSGERRREKIGVTSLRVWMRLADDIYDEEGVLLLAAGARITPSFLQNLHKRGMDAVQLRHNTESQETQGMETVRTKKLDELLVGEVRKRGRFRSLKASERPRLALKNLREEVMRGLERHTATSTLLGEMCEMLQKGKSVAGDKTQDIMREYVDLVTLDFDVLPMIVSMQKVQGDYLFDHSVNVALLSMAMAAQVGMDREQITGVGLGGLLQDIGMMRVPELLRTATRPLTTNERLLIEDHPIYTLDFLEKIQGLPAVAMFVGYQSHERCDSTGYPRRRSGMLIHQDAKIAAIADVYTAMTSPRPYRPALTPYEAAKTILVEGSRGKFDRAIVRAFLDCVSLFPVGSIVELNDSTRAQVVRANPGFHTRPVIAPLDADSKPTHVLVDLAEEPSLKVIRAH